MKQLCFVACCGVLCVHLVFCHFPHDDDTKEEEGENESFGMKHSRVYLSASSNYSKGVKEANTPRMRRSAVEFAATPDHPEVVNSQRSRRGGMDFFASPDCPFHETQPGQDLARIVNTHRSEYRFFFKPLSGFRSLVFRMIVNNRVDFSGDYEWTRKSLVVHGFELGEDTVGRDGWLPVTVEHYRHRVVGTTDKLALRVSVGTTRNLTKNLITRNRWTHEYKGFNVYVEGRTSYSFDCYPSDVLPIPTVDLPISHHVTTPHSTRGLSILSEVKELDKRSEVDLSGLSGHPEEVQEVSTLKIGSSGMDFLTSPNCSVHETQGSQDSAKIVDSPAREYSFFFKPLPGFRSLKISMVVNYKLDLEGPYEWKEKSLVVFGYELGEDTVDRDGWLPVKVEYYRHRVRAAMDLLALKVTVGTKGSLKRSLVTGNRWTYEYKGFNAYIEGRASYTSGCYLSDILSAPSVHSSRSQVASISQDSVVLGVVLSGGLLLVLVALLIFLLMRRVNQGRQPPIPEPLPMEMLLRQTQVSSEPEPTYEEFDEETLARLRRKLDVENLGGCEEERAVLGAPHTTKGRARGFQGPCRSGEGVDSNIKDNTRAPENVYENAGTLRLLEEKERVWKEEPQLGQKPEEHYVEMHGIVSRTNSLNK